MSKRFHPRDVLSRAAKKLRFAHNPLKAAHYDPLAPAGPPAWVLENANIDIDFVGDRAWVDGVGAVAISTLLGEATGNGYDFVLANIEAGVGYNVTGTGGTGGRFLSHAATAALADCTILFEFDHPGSGSGFSYDVFDDPGFATDINLNITATTSHLRDFSSIDLDPGAYATGANKVAATISAAKLSASLNGATVVTANTPFMPVPPDAAEFGTTKVGFIYKRITIFPVVADAALPGLAT